MLRIRCGLLISTVTAICFCSGCNGNQNKSRSNRVESTPAYTWEESDTTLRLIKDKTLIWQYNFNTRKGKPFFHPLNVNSLTLSCESPSDHTWHLGLWFSWKFINGLNYWEYKNEFSTEKTGFQSEGLTQIKDLKFKKNNDFSTNIEMVIQYAPNVKGAEPVMEENRSILVSAPLPDGSYYMDYDLRFMALENEVLLDRTPLPGEEGGQSWGGYAGMSIRFNQQLEGPAHIIPEGILSGDKNDFMYMGFNGQTSGEAGLSIFRHPDYSTEATSWYFITNPSVPFFYFSPSALYDHSYLLKPKEPLELKYRIWILAGKVDAQNLNEKYENYLNEVQHQ